MSALQLPDGTSTTLRAFAARCWEQGHHSCACLRPGETPCSNPYTEGRCRVQLAPGQPPCMREEGHVEAGVHWHDNGQVAWVGGSKPTDVLQEVPHG